jgi:hypothetical protein
LAYRAGQSVDDYCRACKEPRDHRVIAVEADGSIARVICGFCGSQHNYRGNRTPGERSNTRVEPTGPTVFVRGRDPLPVSKERVVLSDAERAFPPMDLEGDEMDIELMLRRVIREECGLTPAAPAEKWRGGEIVLKPGKPGVQEKTIPIDTFFHKVVMLRNRLRVLEQKINASKLAEDEKIDLQSYITGCYGSLTTFNVLFADEADKFKGSGGD